MSANAPRIEPLPESEWDEPTAKLMQGLRRDGKVFNIFATLARHPDLLKRWLTFGTHVLYQSTLPPRDREMIILRMGWLCRAEYEWGHHVAIGKDVGLTADQIKRIAEGPGAEGWTPLEAALIRAVDELHTQTRISDETWKALAGHYNEKQMLDLVFAAGQYKMVSMVLNSAGVQLEEGYEGFDDAPRK